MRLRPLLAVVPLAVAMMLPAANAAQAVTVPADCDPGPDSGVDLSQYNIIIGTNASETLVGSDRPHFICGRLGDDTIFGLGGDDVILGDTATFFGNPNAPGGADVIDAGAGDDQVLAGPVTTPSTAAAATTSWRSRSATTPGRAVKATTRS